MAPRKGGLGKGLDSLIPMGNAGTAAKSAAKMTPAQEVIAAEAERSTVFVSIDKVEPNKEQPRKKFDEEALAELSDSIKQFGVLTPLLVQDRKTYYEIIAGERRWRAAKKAGLKEVPVIIKNYTEQEIAEISLIENIQREDLNPIEEAVAYKRLLDEFHLKQEEVANRVSKSRTAVTNAMRLLKLDERVQEMLIAEQITSGHARALLGLENKEAQFKLAQDIVSKKLSVREIEKLVKAAQNPEKPKLPARNTPTQYDAIYAEIENKLKETLGTKVSIVDKGGKGKIEIEYYSTDELENLIGYLQSVKNN